MYDTQISICVATYKRPSLLKALLESLEEQQSSSLRMQIIVVDNDRYCSARDAVLHYRATSGLDITYLNEPRRGITYARNRALQAAQAEYIAFLDDDEIVAPSWAQAMLDTLIKYDADVVFGPVISQLPNEAPKWTHDHPCFSRPSKPTGSLLQYGATGNVLIRREALGQPLQTFDSSYALTGGEDTDFFYRLYLSGRRLVWCDNAEAFEHIPAYRMTISWVCRRAFRGGQCFSLTVVQRYSHVKKLLWLPSKIIQCLGGVIALPIVGIASRASFMRLLSHICVATGQISTIFGTTFIYKEYESQNYNARVETKIEK